LAKGVVWRGVASTLTGLVAYSVTRSGLAAFGTAVAIACLDVPVKLLAYFIHERVWEHWQWGYYPGIVLWVFGPQHCGKADVARVLAERYQGRYLDSAFLRQGDGLCSDLDYTFADRHESTRRMALVARLLARAGAVVVVSNLTPKEKDREQLRRLLADDRHLLVYVEGEPHEGFEEPAMYDVRLTGVDRVRYVHKELRRRQWA